MKTQKILLFFLCLPVLLTTPYATQGQGIVIASGASVAITGAATIELNNQGFVNNGTYSKGEETMVFSGNTAKTISGSSNTIINNMMVTNSGGIITQLGLITVNNLTIEAASKLTVDPAKQVTVNGSLTNAAGNTGLVIKSTAAGTGSLIHNTASVPATIERYIAAADWGTWDDGWHFISSAVAAQAINPHFTDVTAANYDFYCWNEPTNEWVNFKNNSSWTAANTSANFTTGKGYMAAYKNSGTKIFSGVLNASDVPVSGLAISSGANKSWHLLGNPYTSALTWLTGWETSNISGVANIWNEAGRSYSPISAGGIIPAGNGFMVQVNNVTGSLTIPKANRVHSAQAWYKKSDDIVIQLFARNPDNSSFQESQVRINPESTMGFDAEFDGNFLPGYAPLFYSVMEGENLMVNTLPELNAGIVIPFHFIKNKGTNFTIEAKGIETLSISDGVFLKDKKLGIDHNLSGNNIYSFTSQAGDAAARFELHFKNYTGIKETGAAADFNIYSADGIINVRSLQQQGGKVAVTDMVGRTIATGHIEAGATTRINIHGNTGVYIVSVHTGKRVISTKIIVK